jgi:tellurite resistance protein
MTLDDSGRRTPGGDLLQTTLLVLGRQPGLRTDADKSISSAHCPNCGAPESQSTENACSACGKVLNDGSRNWVLLQWLGLADPAAQALLAGQRTGQIAARAPSHMTGLLAWCVKMSIADGRLDPKERALLEQFAAHDSISPDELNRLISAGMRGDLQIPEPASPAEAREWLTAITRIALSDGTLDRREVQLLKLLGSKANLGEYDVGLLVKRVQAEQYAAARSNVRF